MLERADFWGIPREWHPDLLVYSIMLLATLVLLVRLYREASVWWRRGRPEKRWDHLPARFKRLIQFAVVQTRVLSQLYPGLLHVALAWSFFVFFAGTTLSAIDGHIWKFLEGNIYLVYKLVLDAFTVLFLCGVALAAFRRFIQKPRRLTLDTRFTWSLALITVIVLGGLATESLRLAVEKPDWAAWAPAGWTVAQLWLATGATTATLTTLHLVIWSLHLLTVVVLFVTLPTSTLLHIPTSLLNIFFSDVNRPLGQLKPLAQDHGGELVYAHSLRDLTWKQLLETDACTECGRCQDVCPAFAAGLPLNPKQLILGLREALRHDGQSSLIGQICTEAMAWSCTTCGACIAECPVLVQHLDTMIDLRRSLVNDGQMDMRLQEALANLGRYGNSFGQSERSRVKWAQPLVPKLKDARREPVEYLWFVGDYASYSAGLNDITRKTAEVFRKANLDVGFLHEAERNAGNDVRRVGEEGLFEALVEKNRAAISKASFKAIVTTDPHSYNTLKNEYQLERPVLHYAELLNQLITRGHLSFQRHLDYRITYHDPCYLGRYNGVYDPPRRVIEATGCKIVEMPRTREHALCCGAGGGRIWMEEGKVKERPSEVRIREAAALDGVNLFVAACPKDITMFRDAAKTTGCADRLAVKDLIELVHEAL